MKLNGQYRMLEESYLFSTIAKKVAQYQQGHPEQKLIRLGIGDVTQPLCGCVVQAMRQAVEEMGDKAHFRGYGPEQGYMFLREAIQSYYRERGVMLAAEEIFVSDGAKSDLGNILDLFSHDNTVLIPDPVYPVYVDTNRMDGRNIRFTNAVEENGFLPLPESGSRADIIYLCSPNNPTGAVYSRDALRQWVDYAREQRAVILFDAAYESFVSDPALPRSIFEIPGAEQCAIEFCSLSKMAGFTGTRCGWTVVPQALVLEGLSLNKMWLRRQTTKFNGVSYLVQRGAQAVFSPEGREQTARMLSVYKQNAACIAETLHDLGVWFVGGEHSPYLWLRCPNDMPSWGYFDFLLSQAQVIGTPGAGFGQNGEGYFRLTAFGAPEDTREAVRRLRALPQ